MKKKTVEEEEQLFERTSELALKEAPVIRVREEVPESVDVTERNHRMKKIDLLLTEVMR